MTQDEEPKKSLLSEDEWAEVMAEDYRRKNLPPDALAKARVWERLERQTTPQKRSTRRQTPAILLAAGVVAAVGVSRLLKDDPHGGRDKGDPMVLVATLGAFVLDDTGETPVTVRAPLTGETIVFRVRAPRAGRYAFIVQEGMEAPRVVVESAALSADEEIVRRGEGAYGFKYEGDRTVRFCAIAEETAEKLALRVREPSTGWTTLPGESCVTL